MSLRRRRRGAEDVITPFWHWWATEGRSLAQQSTDSGAGPADFARAMTDRVRTLGDLTWELAAGESSQHVLVLTADGDPALRAVARRVVLAAPEPDDTWSFVDSRPPVADPDAVVLSLGDHALDLDRVQVSGRINGGRFDLQVHHPDYADLSEPDRDRATGLALDATLGEVDTELWLGEVESVVLAPLDAFGLLALRSVVQDLKRQRLDADGLPRWVMLSGETDQGQLVALVRSPLHPVTAPHLDTYVALAVPYRDQVGGLPGTDGLEALRALEHRLGARLGNEGQVVAHVSTAGVRTFHLYVDSTAGLLPTVTDIARSWDQGKVSVHDLHDPAWQAVAHLNRPSPTQPG